MTIYQVWKKKQKKSSKALLYVWPYNLLEKSQIFAFVQKHHMQKYFPVAELRPYTIARNFQSEQKYLKHKPWRLEYFMLNCDLLVIKSKH